MAAERREQVRRGGGNERRHKGGSRTQRGEAIGALVTETSGVAANLAKRRGRGISPAEQEPRGARQRAARGGGRVARAASRGRGRPPFQSFQPFQRRTSIGVQRLDDVRAVGVYFHRRVARVSDERDEHRRELREVVVVKRRRRERGCEVQRMTDSVPDADARGFASGDASIDEHRRAPGRRVGTRVGTRERRRGAGRGRRRPEQQRESRGKKVHDHESNRFERVHASSRRPRDAGLAGSRWLT